MIIVTVRMGNVQMVESDGVDDGRVVVLDYDVLQQNRTHDDAFNDPCTVTSGEVKVTEDAIIQAVRVREITDVPLTDDDLYPLAESQETVCPWCGSGDVNYETVDIDGLQARQEATCHAGGCGRQWVEVYTMSGFVPMFGEPAGCGAVARQRQHNKRLAAAKFEAQSTQRRSV